MQALTEVVSGAITDCARRPDVGPREARQLLLCEWNAAKENAAAAMEGRFGTCGRVTGPANLVWLLVATRQRDLRRYINRCPTAT